jgi:nucleoside-diphosphate-sugar epimerase
MKTLANGRSGTIGKFISADCLTLSGDLKSNEQLLNFEKSADDQTVFIHLAGIVGNSLVEKDLSLSRRVNVLSTQELGEAALKKGIKKFIYVSSCHVYGNNPQVITEEHPLNPQSSYAAQKLEGEKVLLNVFSDDPKKLLIIRVFSILDFGMPEFTLGGAIEKLIANPESAKIGNSDDNRDFLTPRTVAKNLELIAKSDLSGIYNLCSSKGETIESAAIKMASSKGVTLPSTAFIHNVENKTSIVGDNSKIKKAVSGLDLSWNIDQVN